MTDLRTWLPRGVDAIDAWNQSYGDATPHPSLVVSDDVLGAAFGRLVERLSDNYPFGSPRYVGQMLKPPHPAAVLGYTTAMLINPNNHALDGGPATAAMEKEVVARLATMFGYDEHLGHLTSSGTIANLEALWVARESHPGKAIAFSADAHYTHARMCGVLGVERDRGALRRGRPDGPRRTSTRCSPRVASARSSRRSAPPASAPSTRCRRSSSAPAPRAPGCTSTRRTAASSPWWPTTPPTVSRARRSARSPRPTASSSTRTSTACSPTAAARCSSATPTVGRFYVHDSPYTYFSSAELHLGEISLECSRAGASAAALWLTLEVLPLTDAGLGQALRAGPSRRARVAPAAAAVSAQLAAYQAPELDIVAYFPRRPSLSAIDAATEALFHAAAAGDPAEQIHLATYTVTAAAMARPRARRRARTSSRRGSCAAR